jgi:hypothetical protein
MIDLHTHYEHVNYEPPALVRIGAIVDIAEELQKFGASVKPSAHEPGEPADWSGGRVS